MYLKAGQHGRPGAALGRQELYSLFSQAILSTKTEGLLAKRALVPLAHCLDRICLSRLSGIWIVS
jgi:hypothetical protein